MNYTKLKKEIGKLKITEKAFIDEYCDIGVQGFNKAIKRNTLTIRSLELISKGLKLPMTYWWDESNDQGNNDRGDQKEKDLLEIEELKKQIAKIEEEKKGLMETMGQLIKKKPDSQAQNIKERKAI